MRGGELRVEHDVRRLEVAVLQARACARGARRRRLEQDAGALRELERRPDASQLEPVDELHDDDGRVGVEAALEDLDDAPIGEERERAGFAQEPVDARGLPPCAIAAHDLGGDDPVQAAGP